MHWSNLTKLIQAVILLQRGDGATIADIQRELGLSRRSVCRLFETLEEMRFPLYDERLPLAALKAKLLALGGGSEIGAGEPARLGMDGTGAAVCQPACPLLVPEDRTERPCVPVVRVFHERLDGGENPAEPRRVGDSDLCLGAVSWGQCTSPQGVHARGVLRHGATSLPQTKTGGQSPGLRSGSLLVQSQERLRGCGLPCGGGRALLRGPDRGNFRYGDATGVPAAAPAHARRGTEFACVGGRSNRRCTGGST
jgi:hypothetical protein